MWENLLMDCVSGCSVSTTVAGRCSIKRFWAELIKARTLHQRMIFWKIRASKEQVEMLSEDWVPMRAAAAASVWSHVQPCHPFTVFHHHILLTSIFLRVQSDEGGRWLIAFCTNYTSYSFLVRNVASNDRSCCSSSWCKRKSSMDFGV